MADGYDETVEISDRENTYPFAGYKEVLNGIFQAIMEKPNASVLDIGFGTDTLTKKLYAHGCSVYGHLFIAPTCGSVRYKNGKTPVNQSRFSFFNTCNTASFIDKSNKKSILPDRKGIYFFRDYLFSKLSHFAISLTSPTERCFRIQTPSLLVLQTVHRQRTCLSF